MDESPIDLRSDTVTQPSPEMRAAMASAQVGDSERGEDPSVNALERCVAEMFGMESAMFVPSGSMANQVALRLLAGPGEELLCDIDSHVLLHEGGALAVHGGIQSRT